MVGRRRRNETVVWIIFLLLQQFQIVLLANLETMKNETQGRHEHLESDDFFNNRRDKRNANEDGVNIVLQRVIQAGELFKRTNDDWKEKIFETEDSQGPGSAGNHDCNPDAERPIRDTWAENEGLVLPLYLSSASLFSYLKGCDGLMKDQITDLVDNVGTDDALEYIGYNEELMNIDYDNSDDDDDENDEDDDDEIDPEGYESENLNDATHLISENIEATAILSDAFLSFNGSTLRSFAGMDEVIDDTINQYLVMSTMLEENEKPKRRKRSADDGSNLNLKLGIQTAQKTAINTYSIYEKQLTVKRLNNLRSLARTKRTSRIENIVSLESSDVNSRHRRDVNDNINTLTVFIKSSRHDCRLLTFQGGKFTFSKFDELDVTSQLWVISESHVQHYQSGLYLYLKDGRFSMAQQMRHDNTNFRINSGQLKSSDGCTITSNDNDTDIRLKTSCNNQHNSTGLSYVTFEESQENLGSIVCMFVIQKVKSCTVLTYAQDGLKMRPFDDQQVEYQLWYWDNNYIRNAETNKYLTSSWVDSLLAVKDLHADINQKWKQESDSLVAQDLPKDVVVVLNNDAVRVGRKDDYVDDDTEVRIVTLDAYKNSTCDYSNKYFIIKHDDFPCLVLCAEDQVAEPTLTTKLMVIGLTFCTSIPSGLLFLICFKASEAVIAGIAVGLILAAVAALVVQFAEAFKVEYDGANFRTFSELTPDKCLWYESDGSIINVHGEKYLSIEYIGANDFLTIGLVEETDQMFQIESNKLKERQNDCVISIIRDDSENADEEDKLALSCIGNEEGAGEWSKVFSSDSSNFIEQTSCFYFLRQTNNNEDSCRVLTANTKSNVTSITARLPSSLTLFEQLWFLEGENFVNVKSGESVNISDEGVGNTITSIPFTDEGTKTGFISGCKKEMYFLKSQKNPCHLMTHKNLSTGIYTGFEEFDKANFINQLWVFEENEVRNAGTAILESNFNATRLEKVKFEEEFDSYASKILCPFFLQDLNKPCGILTVINATDSAFFGPLASDIMDKQLWYKSGDTLIHLATGRMLTTTNGSHFQLAQLDLENLSTGFSLQNNNGTLLIKPNTYRSVYSWKRLDSAKLFEDPSIMSCQSYNRSYFFLKDRSDPCVLLTAGKANERPYFDVFDEKHAQKQLWYLEFSRLINMETGLVLELNVDTGKYIMREQLYHETLQNLEFVNRLGDTASIRNTKHDCVMKSTLSNEEKSLVCSDTFSDLRNWEVLPYIALEDISKLMCLYYIRNMEKPCEFLTGFEKSSVLKVRPLTEQLIQKQLFYTKENFVVHYKTRLYLTANDGSLTLAAKQGPITQKWTMLGTHFVLKGDTSKMLSFHENDGVAYVKESYNDSSVIWEKVPLDYEFENDEVNNPHCSENGETNTLTVFFITSTQEPCTVLTAGALGEGPTFKAYDEDKHDYQLWYLSKGHILNLATGMALMVEENKLENEHDIVLWNKYTFSKAQRFDVAFSTSRILWHQNNCALKSLRTETGVTLVCNNAMSDLKIIPFDENGSYYDKITCLFFIKSLKTPCELLTVTNNAIRMRPISGETLNGQLWSWNNKQLINQETNKMLCIWMYGSYSAVSLARKEDVSENYVWEYDWVYERGFIKSVGKKNGRSIVLGFQTDDGSIGAPYISYSNNDVQQWVFVKKNDGIKLAEQNNFHCKGHESHTMYLIRNEYDDCPVLKTVGNDRVGYQKVDDSGKGIDNSVWWTRNDQHICSASLQKCLAVKPTNSYSMTLEQQYAFEKNQKWSLQHEYIKLFHGHQKVTYSGSSIILASDQSDADKQKWKWFTSGQIEGDTKHLRCSRCYNKGEEKAAEIISYIPLISLFYNIGRSIAYGVKNCPKVALGALVDSLIDLAMDAIMVLSAGSASAFALGIKTAVKFGFKAGLKAFANGIKSMIKVAIKSIKKGIVNFVKTGFRRTLKKQLVKMKMNLKAVISGLKAIPSTLKKFTKAGFSNLKRFVKKSFKSLKSLRKTTSTNWKVGMKRFGHKMVTTMKNMPDTIKSQLKKLGTGLKRKLKTLNDKLAKKAEKAIKKADDIKTPKKIRCRRGTGFCAYPIGQRPIDRMRHMSDFRNGNLQVPELPEKHFDDFLAVRRIVKPEDTVAGQYASIGLKQADEMKFSDYTKRSNNKLKDKSDNFIDYPNQHTEPFLLDTVEKQIKKVCSPEMPCDVVLFTKLSPCHDRKDGMETCLSMITNKCKAWLQNFGTKCLVGFEKYYEISNPFSDDWLDVFKDTVKRSELPASFGAKFDDVLADEQLRNTLSGIMKADFHDILQLEGIPKKLDTFFPGGALPQFDQFYATLKNKADNLVKNKLNNDKTIQALISKNDDMNKYYNKLLNSKDNINKLTQIKNDFSKQAAPEVKKNAGMLASKVKSEANKIQKEMDELVNKVSVQLKKRLNTVAEQAEISKLLTDSVSRSAGAVDIFHMSAQMMPPGNMAG